MHRYLQPRTYLAAFMRKCVDWNFTIDVSPEAELREQREYFADVGLNYDDAREVLDATLGEMNMPKFDSANGMMSEHWPLFAAIAARGGVERILEIGTFDAGGTEILSRLFPAAQIYTVDLPDDSKFFTSSYGREDAVRRRDHIARRDQRLSRIANVKFLQVNSFDLPLHTQGKNFDLIWIDGDHDYPAVAWDFHFSCHNLSDHGWMLADDIYRHPLARRLLPYSNDSDALVRYLEAEIGLRPSFVKKRLAAAKKNLIQEKHILVARKRA